MLTGYAKLFHAFRDEDFVAFTQRHDALYTEARRTGEYAEVVRSFYGLMGRVIATTYGDSWHFVPPEHDGQSRKAATRALHRRLASFAGLSRGRHGIDVGSGFGGAMLDLAQSVGVEMTGVTMGGDEARACNAAAARLGVAARCRAVVADAQALPFADASFDGGYAIYAFKYLPTLDRVFSEIARVLRPGARFAIYDIVKTERYREDNPDHARIVHGFEYACGMPDLHTQLSMSQTAVRHGLKDVLRLDLSDRIPWYHYFEATPLLPWLVRSPTVRRFVRGLELGRVLPRGFARFNETFASGIVEALLEGGKKGIISGSSLLVLER